MQGCRWSHSCRHTVAVVLVAVVVPLAACAVLSVFRDSIANTNAALVLVLLIVAAAATGMRAAGLAAAVSSAVWFDFFLTVPYTQFAITDPADVETDVLLLLVGAGRDRDRAVGSSAAGPGEP